MNSYRPIFLLAILLVPSILLASAEPNFGEFDRRARAGEHLSVVFFGASLTWGANSTDPQHTSYRADVQRRLETAYPQAHFACRDSAIGGTGSQLGVFRLDRDVLSHHPDLVFLDFSANDDIYSDTPEILASYEAIVRRILLEARCPLVQVIFPFKWNAKREELAKMKRRDAHLAIAAAYNTAVGDAIALTVDRVEKREASLDAIWPADGVHPGDVGYSLFADAAWNAFQEAVRTGRACVVPPKMLYADTYMTSSRARLTSISPIPAGWHAGRANLTSAYFDMLMSRWLDDELIASNRVPAPGPYGKPTATAQDVSKLQYRFRGRMALLFGESTPISGKYRLYLDGKPIEQKPPRVKTVTADFDAGDFARRANGNVHLVQVVAEGLDPAVEHVLEIEPVFTSATAQELRIESICVAGIP
ncbi:MAG TPA: SGNH/GDSL hydrolase family protein [Tepidisphaeraceae bacterium]|jgi:lysophospholipase L1-like esterase|nr:SGNH/GDSL hydrolase family protein [Tepidisphaeraceae bacterium]